MLRLLTASDPRFKSLHFRPGLNVVLAEQHENATATDTRNGVGKTSFVALLHFLLGGNAGKSSLFRTDALRSWSFTLELDVGSTTRVVTRTGATPSKFLVSVKSDDVDAKPDTLTQADWQAILRKEWFGLETNEGPSVRSLLSYFMRRVDDGAFQDAFKHTYQQTPSDYQVGVSFLLGLDWRLASAWDEVRKREKTVKDLARALKDGRLGDYSVGSVAKLRTEVTLAQRQLETLQANIQDFRVVESYSELEREADEITANLRALSVANAADRNLVTQLRETYESEDPPSSDDLAALYEAAGVQLGELVSRRFDEVRTFHESIVQNRERHLEDEINRTETRIAAREDERSKLDNRRSEILQALNAGGALEELAALQEELARASTRLQELRNSYRVADELAAGKAGVKQARQDLFVKLQADQRERDQQLAAVIARFEEFSAALYDERVGSLEIGASENGPTFSVSIDAGKSKGIGNMQIFCFDLLVAELCAQRELGPGFLVHDSHLFDGVDERQVGRALALAETVAVENGFQYVVTMNSDAVPATLPEGFDLASHVLDVTLTDTVDDGGLFGFRF